MSGEYVPKSSVFDLDALDQNSVGAAQAADEAEFQRVRSLPDYTEVLTERAHLIQEFDTDDEPLEIKAMNFLRYQAIQVWLALQEGPSRVPDQSRASAARFFDAPDTSDESIIAGFDRYHDFIVVITRATYFEPNLTIAQARAEVAATRPHLMPDSSLVEKPLHSSDPFEAAFEEHTIEIIDDTDLPPE